MIKMTTRTMVKIISMTLAVLVVLGVFAYRSWAENSNTKYVLSAAYQNNVAEIASRSETLLSSLQKLEYAKSPYQFVTLVSEIRSSADGVKAAFKQIPGAGESLQQTSKLLTQTGDYSYFLAKKCF